MRTVQFLSSAAARCTVVVSAVLILAGCVSFHDERPPMTAPTADSAASDTAAPNLYASDSERYPVSVVRTSRYQLVPLAPTSGEQYLLQQVVTTDLPPSMAMTVRDGIEHVLRDSGLHLCPPTTLQAGFLSLPLPAVHRELGPTTLRRALQTLAGPAWRLTVDYAARSVCFVRRPSTHAAAAGADTHQRVSL